MTIIKYNDYFINEDRKYPIMENLILDMVIDSDGNLYDGKNDDYPLTKGHINRKKEGYEIFGDDGKVYFAGIDKNGVLKCYVTPDKNGFLLFNNNRVQNNREERTNKEPFWNIKYHYREYISHLPTGKSYVKIDMEVIKIVRRYSANIGKDLNGIEKFRYKMDIISKKFKKRNRAITTIQESMSIVSLLSHLIEIKDHFVPTSAGTLFESFMAGLIPNSIVLGDNSSCDIRSGNINYQVKLSDPFKTKYINIAISEGQKWPNYYLVGLKYFNRIDVYLLNGNGNISIKNENDFHNYLNENRTSIKLKSLQDNHKSPWSIPLLKVDIDNIIENIAYGLKDAHKNLFDSITTFNDCIDSILTGVDKFGNPIVDNFIGIQNESMKTLEEMRYKLDKLFEIVNKKRD